MDPLTNIVMLLQPHATFSKVVNGAGAWRIRREGVGNPFYCVVLDGACALTLDSEESVSLVAGDFVLVPETRGFTFASSSLTPPEDTYSVPVEISPNTYLVGDENSTQNAHLLVGHCEFVSPDSAILLALLPKLIHIRGAKRLATLVELVIEESRAQRPGRDAVLARLLEILLIEAFRTNVDAPEVPGLLLGLADERLGSAIRKIHENVGKSWTVDQLAREAALSRSAFFQKFRKTVGFTPMEYVTAWRMAIAKDLLRRQSCTMADIAERIGYKSASAFSTAFTNYSGQPPSKFSDTVGID